MAVPRHFYRQAGVLAWKDDAILLVTTAKGNWTIPKGVVEPDRTPAQSAEQEAYEEGGIRGRVREPAIGAFEYDKWGGPCRVEVFEMEVTEVLDTWPEGRVRRRTWVSLKDAAAQVRLEPLRAFLQSASAKHLK